MVEPLNRGMVESGDKGETDDEAVANLKEATEPYLEEIGGQDA